MWLQGVGLLNITLFYLGLGLRIIALVDALRYQPAAYEAAGKLTKNAWLVILGLAVAVGLFGGSLVGLFNIAGIIAAIVYLVDVRPAVRAVGGGSRRDPRGRNPDAW